MQFTPQQLAGAQRYGSKTRVGNWLEDKCLEETKLSGFRRAQLGGTLMMNDLRSKDATYNRPVSLTKAADGVAKYGDVVMLVSTSTKTALSVDLTEQIFEADSGCKLVTSVLLGMPPPLQPKARCAFKIVPLDETATSEVGRPLHYGEPFRLACSDNLLVDPEQNAILPSYYLASTLKNERNASRMANQQPVYMTQALDATTIWSCEKIPMTNAKCGVLRQLSTDEPVPSFSRCDAGLFGAGVKNAVVIQHKGTMQSLATNPKFADYTDFGRELEVSCHNYFSTRKVEALASEMKGLTTGATNARLETSLNWWTIVAADDADPDPVEDLPPKQSAVTVLAHATEALAALPEAEADLQTIADQCPGNVIQREDLAAELVKIGLPFDTFLTNALLDVFDEHKDGMIHMPSFLAAVFPIATDE